MRRLPTTSVVGALVGLLVALGCVAVMPKHYVATVSVALPTGVRIDAPTGSKLTPQAQLYGALGPGRTPATLVFTAHSNTAAQARTAAVSALRRWRLSAAATLHGRSTSAAVTIEHSPRPVRDALLGLIAGLLVAIALTTVGRRPRVGAL